MTTKLPFLVGALLLVLPISLSAQITSESENNNSDTTADGPLGSGVNVTGSISNNSDVDWYKFNVGGPGTITITLNHNSRRDFDLFLYKSTGGAVATAETSNRPEVLTYTATSAEEYFLKVQRYSGRGNYNFTATFPTGGEGSPTPTPTATPTPTPSGGLGPRPAKPSNQVSYITGNSADSGKSPVNGPGLLLMGGNFDIDEGFLNRAYPVANGGDVVVLRSSGTNGYNSYLYNLTSGSLKPDSVETIVVDSVTKANSAYVEWVIKSAEFVYIAGGDQSDYLNFWKDTKVESAIRYAYDQGGVIGGISAGCAVQGEFIYDPDGINGIYSSEAASNICHPNMNISNGFTNLGLGANIITDTHFSQRNRMGRLMAFMALITNPTISPTDSVVTGVGVDEDTSMFIDKNGVGHVDGDFAVYVLRKTSGTTYNRVNCGQTLRITNMSRTKLTAGDTFNFTTGSNTGSTINISIDGSSCSYSFTQGADCFYTPANVY
ncbi:MAG: Type 1 glutamine amidotransferase-like domain-containing protein [Sumerlaeia bacterium]